jgi:hypothetical protein
VQADVVVVVDRPHFLAVWNPETLFCGYHAVVARVKDYHETIRGFGDRLGRDHLAIARFAVAVATGQGI